MDTLNIELTIVVISAIVNILLGLLTLKNNFKSSTNKLFFLFTLVLVIYVVINFLSRHQLADGWTIFYIRLVMASALIINLLFFLLVTTFPKTGISIHKNTLYLVVFSTFILLPLTQTDLIFTGVVPGTIQPIPGKAIPLFLIHTLLFIGGGIFNLVKRYKKSEGNDKNQYRFLLIGTGIMFAAIILTNLLFVVLLNRTNFVGLLPIYTSIFAGIIAYTIVKHSLFNIKVLATQLLTVIIWIVIFAELLTAPTPSRALVDALVLLLTIIFGILLIRSVQNEVRQREQLAALYLKLELLDKQKDEFLSMAAHEMRAPMTAIKGYVSMVLEGDTGDIPEKARGFLADTNNITDRLIRLVNNMLNVSRIEEGRMTFQDEVEHLSVPVRSVFNQFVPEAERKGLKYTLSIPQAVKDKVRVDPDRVQEVIGNFISNAVKYTDKGFVKVKLIQPSESIVRVEVSDSGPGISHDEQKNLFKKFYRVESNVGKTTGTGLGLYISKLLMEKFKGKIGVNSDVGKGTTFWFELPLTN